MLQCWNTSSIYDLFYKRQSLSYEDRDVKSLESFHWHCSNNFQWYIQFFEQTIPLSRALTFSSIALWLHSWYCVACRWQIPVWSFTFSWCSMRISTTMFWNFRSIMAATVSSCGLINVGPNTTPRLATVIRFCLLWAATLREKQHGVRHSR